MSRTTETYQQNGWRVTPLTISVILHANSRRFPADDKYINDDFLSQDVPLKVSTMT
jgi:hypothetical protein